MRADPANNMLVFQRINFQGTFPLRRDIGEVFDLASQCLRGSVGIGGQQAIQGSGIIRYPVYYCDTADLHRHIASVAGKCPLATDAVISQPDGKAVPPIYLVDHIGYRSQISYAAVERQPSRPFVFVHRLAQQIRAWRTDDLPDALAPESRVSGASGNRSSSKHLKV